MRPRWIGRGLQGEGALSIHPQTTCDHRADVLLERALSRRASGGRLSDQGPAYTDPIAAYSRHYARASFMKAHPNESAPLERSPSAREAYPDQMFGRSFAHLRSAAGDACTSGAIHSRFVEFWTRAPRSAPCQSVSKILQSARLSGTQCRIQGRSSGFAASGKRPIQYPPGPPYPAPCKEGTYIGPVGSTFRPEI